MDKWSKKAYEWALVYVMILAAIGLIYATPQEILTGLNDIMFATDILITDYVALTGIGPAFMNVALVTGITLFIMYYNKMPFHGSGLMVLGLMSGFSFFGKNILNMWFILFGTYLYCKIRNQPYSKYLVPSFLATALGPLISCTLFSFGLSIKSLVISYICGLIIGFVIPLLAEHTDGILRNLSLYNGGFAVGLLAMVLTPILRGFGYEFEPVMIWAEGYNQFFAILLYGMCICLILGAFIVDRKNALTNYRNILKRPGNLKEDFLELDGIGAVMINMGVNGAIGTTYILMIGGDLNGATLGGILTIIGFSAKGKHAKSMIPVMFGVFIGGMVRETGVDYPQAQLAALFGMTLCPVAGAYGVVAGIVAGFIHASVAIYAGAGYSGVNLYNNGFAGGIVSIVMYPILSAWLKPNTYREPSPSMVPQIKEMEPVKDIMFMEEEDITSDMNEEMPEEH